MEPFRVEVDSVKEGVKLMDTLAFYDIFQYENKIKPDYANAGGLEMYNEEWGEWENWYIEKDFGYFDDPEDYLDTLKDLGK